MIPQQRDRKKPSGFALQLNLLILRLTRNWRKIAITVLGLYITLPFVAPLSMQAGLTGVGNTIYTLYSPFCHQFAFRSFFLFGEQYAYPREVTGTDLVPFETYAIESESFLEKYTEQYARFNNGTVPLPITRSMLDSFTPELQFGSRAFRGDETFGYKVTLCERDIAIYIMMFVGLLIFTRFRKRIRPLPLWIYVIAGLGPIGLDGFSQLLSYPPFEFWEVRETLPIFRVVTGAMFGLMTAWLGFPYLEGAMNDTRRQLESKFRRAEIEV